MGSAVDHRPTPRQPLNHNGPSRDQPAPGSPRHIPAGSPEPESSVAIVAVLEQDPAMERWERVGPDEWLHAGYRPRMVAAQRATEASTVPWEQVGVCPHGTRHDLKDVTGRGAAWDDRPEDLLPEVTVTVELTVTVDRDGRDWRRELREACPAAIVTPLPGGAAIVASRDAPTALAAVEAIGRAVESVQGLRVVELRASRAAGD